MSCYSVRFLYNKPVLHIKGLGTNTFFLQLIYVSEQRKRLCYGLPGLQPKYPSAAPRHSSAVPVERCSWKGKTGIYCHNILTTASFPPPPMGGDEPARGQTAELKKTLNRQCTYAFAEFGSIRRGYQSLRLTSISTSQELIPRTPPLQSAGKEAGKNSAVQGHVNKNRKVQGDTRWSVPGGDRTVVTTTTGPPTVDKISAQLTNNSMSITLI